MKNKRFTRIMSLAMAMCMVFAIVPTASANTASEDVVYEFISTKVGLTSSNNYVFGKTSGANGEYHDNLESLKTTIEQKNLGWNIDSVALSAETDGGNVLNLMKTGLSLSVTGDKEIGSFVIKVNVETAGYYDVKINIVNTDLKRSTCSGHVKLYKTSADSSVASHVLGDAKYVTTSEDMGVAYLDAGDYYLEYYLKHAGNGTSFLYAKGLTLTPVNGDVFAEKFAVIEKNNTDNYDIHFFGGLKSIDYKAVGFEVTVGGVAQPDITTTNVYEQIRVSVDKSATDITAADFGTGSEYIYYATLEDVAAGSEILITPYVLDGDNNKIYYGKTFTYTVTTAA